MSKVNLVCEVGDKVRIKNFELEISEILIDKQGVSYYCDIDCDNIISTVGCEDCPFANFQKSPREDDYDCEGISGIQFKEEDIGKTVFSSHYSKNSKKMKAYEATTVACSNGSTVVFAENAGEAKKLAMYTDACEYADFTEIHVRRIPKADCLYNGKSEADWYDENTRTLLVKEYGWRCFEPEPEECEKCFLKEFCEGGV